MIKIVSGFSIPIGPTIALVNLCNQLNGKEHHCILYGPDNWHMDKCKSAKINEFHPESGDIIIVHNIALFSVTELYHLQNKIEELRKKHISNIFKCIFSKHMHWLRKHDDIKIVLSCQENDLFPIRRLNYTMFDKIHYVHSWQVNYHKLKHDHFVCPNFCNPLRASEHKPGKVAGIIGSIRQENQTDLSIEKALWDGMETVILYGYLKDPVYYYKKIVPLVKKYPGKIKYAGFIDDKQTVYDSISDVYCTVCKPWSFVKKECLMTSTRYHGPDISAMPEESLTNHQIVNIWEKELNL
ncbi:MAG: hypothetical protein JXA41_10410 [Deltaproteobacteria bacterium]|nr:hypothetical protein [Deltaproteobacteria bacterium]